MSSMPATGGHSEACCNTPPVVVEGYEPKGEYYDLDGMRTYVTGPDDATRGIVVIMDIFGFKDQTLQGCDILATADENNKYKVFMPDWFNGEPVPMEWYPPDTPEKQEKLGAFFQKNAPPKVASKLPEFVKTINEKHGGITSWGVLGFCWGGKVATLVTSGPSNPFSAAAACHPAMVNADDAAGISVPFVLLGSKDEPANQVRRFENALNVPHHVEIFQDQIHGWMAARGDLADEHVRAQYARGYQTVLTFWDKEWR